MAIQLAKKLNWKESLKTIGFPFDIFQTKIVWNFIIRNDWIQPELINLEKGQYFRKNLPVTQVSSPSPCLVSFTHWGGKKYFFQLLFAVHSPSTFEKILSKTSYTPLNSFHPNSTMYLANICVSIGKGIHPPSLPGMKRCLISKSDKTKKNIHLKW